MRDAVGDEMDLMVDLHARCWPAMAIQYCQAFEPFGLLWFEEPCPTEDIEATCEVTRKSRMTRPCESTKAGFMRTTSAARSSPAD